MSGMRKKGPARRERKSGRKKGHMDTISRGMPLKQAALNGYMTRERYANQGDDADEWDN